MTQCTCALIYFFFFFVHQQTSRMCLLFNTLGMIRHCMRSPGNMEFFLKQYMMTLGALRALLLSIKEGRQHLNLDSIQTLGILIRRERKMKSLPNLLVIVHPAGVPNLVLQSTATCSTADEFDSPPCPVIPWNVCVSWHCQPAPGSAAASVVHERSSSPGSWQPLVCIYISNLEYKYVSTYP